MYSRRALTCENINKPNARRGVFASEQSRPASLCLPNSLPSRPAPQSYQNAGTRNNDAYHRATSTLQVPARMLLSGRLCSAREHMYAHSHRHRHKPRVIHACIPELGASSWSSESPGAPSGAEEALISSPRPAWPDPQHLHLPAAIVYVASRPQIMSSLTPGLSMPATTSTATASSAHQHHCTSETRMVLGVQFLHQSLAGATTGARLKCGERRAPTKPAPKMTAATGDFVIQFASTNTTRRVVM